MIDLHTHTDESDGSFTPAELLEAAKAAGIHTLAITDHDTFAGYEKAAALDKDLRLICGIELNTHHERRSVHLLAYFPHGEPGLEFQNWLSKMAASRRERNQHLIEKLRELNVDISLREVEALGRSLAGRPHFARILVEKGYAADREEAFARFIGETGSAFVERESPGLFDTIALIDRSGGIASLPHPIRLGKRDHVEEERFIASLRASGLDAIEVFHSDHTARDIERYHEIAVKYGYAETGGSDFHGTYKPNVKLGFAANGTIPIPDSVGTALAAQ